MSRKTKINRKNLNFWKNFDFFFSFFALLGHFPTFFNFLNNCNFWIFLFQLSPHMITAKICVCLNWPLPYLFVDLPGLCTNRSLCDPNSTRPSLQRPGSTEARWGKDRVKQRPLEAETESRNTEWSTVRV